MSENLGQLQQVYIVFLGGMCEEYYFDSERNSIGRLMDDGCGRFYNPLSDRWEWINMKLVVKVYYGKDKGEQA